MNRSAAVVLIQQGLGFRSDLSAEIILALQNAQTELELEPELPWFLLEEEASLATVAAQAYVAIPTGFIREHEEGGLYYFDSTADEDEQYTKLEKSNLQTLIAAHNAADGVPDSYDLIDERFYLRPIPDAVYALRLKKYYKQGVTLSTDVENEWLKYAHEIICGKAGMTMAEDLRDPGALNKFTQMEMRGRKRMIEFQTAREEHGQTRQMGGKD